MKNPLLTLTLFLLTNLAFSQNGTISGSVTDNNKKALFGVNVSLKNTVKGTFEMKTFEQRSSLFIIVCAI